MNYRSERSVQRHRLGQHQAIHQIRRKTNTGGKAEWQVPANINRRYFKKNCNKTRCERAERTQTSLQRETLLHSIALWRSLYQHSKAIMHVLVV